MNYVYPSFTTHVTYEAGAPSAWRRLLGWDTRGRRVQENINPAVVVNRISSKSSKQGLLYKLGLKKPKNPPTNVQHDAGYFLTSNGYVAMNAPPAYFQSVQPQRKPTTLKKYSTIPANMTSTPEISSRKWRRHSESYPANHYQHIPQSAARVMAIPAPPPNHLHRSSSTTRRYHDSGPAVLKKTVRWADGEPPGRRRRSYSEPHRHHHAHPQHPIYNQGLAAYDQYYPTWEQYRQANRPPQQQQLYPSHSYSYSYPPEAQQPSESYVIPRQRRKSVPYHLLPTPVIHVPQRC